MEETGTVHTRRFLLELWLEPRVQPVSYLGLRGRIQNLESGARRAVKSIDEVENFIVQAFDEAGAPSHRWGGPAVSNK